MNIFFRKATTKDKDIECIFDFIRKLAIYEKDEESLISTKSDIKDSLSKGYFEAIFSYNEIEITGYCLFFYNYSTWRGKRGIYIEELFVEESYRKKGIGKSMINEVIRIAKENDCARVDLSVLNWNPAIIFYKKLGFSEMSEWRSYRLNV